MMQPRGNALRIFSAFLRIFCIFWTFFLGWNAHFPHFPPNREGHGTGHKVTFAIHYVAISDPKKNPSKYGIQGIQNDQKCVLDPKKMMLFNHNFKVWLKNVFSWQGSPKMMKSKSPILEQRAHFCAFLAHCLRIFSGLPSAERIPPPPLFCAESISEGSGPQIYTVGEICLN